jgi:hypothetical protein
MKALYIPVGNDGDLEVIDVPEGARAELDALYAKLGCNLVEVVEVKGGCSMFIDEEGKYTRPDEYNGRATSLALRNRSISLIDWISGPAVVLGPPDDEGEAQGLTDSQVASFRQLARL